MKVLLLNFGKVWLCALLATILGCPKNQGNGEDADPGEATESEGDIATGAPSDSESDESETESVEVETDSDTNEDVESSDPVDDDAGVETDSADDSEMAEFCPEDGYVAGDFCVHYLMGESTIGKLSITHRDDPERVIFETVAGSPFINGAIGTEKVTSNRASFEIEDKIKTRCVEQTVHEIQGLAAGGVLVSGDFEDCDLSYTLTFAEVLDGHLQFNIELIPPAGRTGEYNRVFFIYGSTADEKLFGFGQQYSFFDLKGKKLPIWTQEQGHGRGVEPLTWVLNTFGDGAAGYWYTTYTSVPYYVSSLSRSLFLEQYEYSEFDMTGADRIAVKIFSPRLSGRILNGATPLDIVERYTEYTGRMRPLPDWTQEGAIVRAYKGSAEVEQFVDRLLDAEIPLAGLWVEDWMGRRQNFTGTRLWWNWRLDETIYPDWSDFLLRLKEQNIRVTTYFNPYLTDASSNRNHDRNLFAEARDKGYFVTKPNGDIFMFGSGGFEGAIVDLTNPAARSWYKSFMREQLELGVAGWMADFGEAIPYDGVLHSGVDSRIYHNQFPAEWARLNREAVEEAGKEDEAIFWTRSGNALTPRYSTLCWLGDQSVTWDSFDGIKTAVIGLLSAGLSGYSLIHGDVGGYLSVDYGIYKIVRTKELLFRWIELGAFQTVFRTHDTLRPESNPQIYSDEESLDMFRKFAEVFKGLAPYRKQLMDQAEQTGQPLVGPVFLYYPDDAVAWDLQYQFMLGPDFLIAPVLDPDVDQMPVYLPRETWVHLWTGAEYDHADQGSWVDVNAPIGSPPVFYKKGSLAGEALREYLNL